MAHGGQWLRVSPQGVTREQLQQKLDGIAPVKHTFIGWHKVKVGTIWKKKWYGALFFATQQQALLAVGIAFARGTLPRELPEHLRHDVLRYLDAGGTPRSHLLELGDGAQAVARARAVRRAERRGDEPRVEDVQGRDTIFTKAE
eukprot:gene6022-2669_t